MRQARLIERLDGLRHIFEVLATATLVAKRPDEDTGVIAHPADMVLGTLYHGIAEELDRGELLIGMTLHISLGQHIEAVLIAEVIEDRIIGIVTGAHCIDIEALHGLDILFNLSISDGTTIHRRKIMTVDTMEHHALAIDNQRTIATDAHLTEAHLTTTDILDMAFGIL